MTGSRPPPLPARNRCPFPGPAAGRVPSLHTGTSTPPGRPHAPHSARFLQPRGTTPTHPPTHPPTLTHTHYRRILFPFQQPIPPTPSNPSRPPRALRATPPNRRVAFGVFPTPPCQPPPSTPASPPRGPCGVPEDELPQRREGRDADGEGGGAGVADLIAAAICVCGGVKEGERGVSPGAVRGRKLLRCVWGCSEWKG